MRPFSFDEGAGSSMVTGNARQVTGEEGPLHDELSEDAANGPDVDGGGVVLGAQEDLRSAVPQCYDLRRRNPASASGYEHPPTRPQRPTEGNQRVSTYLVRVRADRDAEGAGETEVSKLEHAAAVDEEVLGLEIPVKDAVGVAERDALQKRSR